MGVFDKVINPIKGLGKLGDMTMKRKSADFGRFQSLITIKGGDPVKTVEAMQADKTLEYFKDTKSFVYHGSVTDRLAAKLMSKDGSGISYGRTATAIAGAAAVGSAAAGLAAYSDTEN